MPLGILLQATMGHGWVPSAQAPYQKLKIADGSTRYIFCPLDNEFKKYVYESVRKLAKLKPDFFMVDDDFRLLTGRGGCYCPLHIAKFNALTGKVYTEESLREAVQSNSEIAGLYDNMLQNSLVDLAKEIRRAIDETDPSIPCSFCCCSEDVRHAVPVVKALTVPGEKPVLRINNGMYMKDSPRSFSHWNYKTARQIQAFPEDWQILCEPDTCPQNRYSTSAAMMHAHITLSITERANGGKLWITRIDAYEPESGLLYRQTLSKYAEFYRTLAALPVQWDGVAVPLPQNQPFNFPHNVKDSLSVPDCNWGTEIFAKMGIPFYYSSTPAGMTAISGDDTTLLNNVELQNILKNNPVLLDGKAAVNIAQRGFAEQLGFSAEPWKGEAATFEIESGKMQMKTSAALSFAKLTPLHAGEVSTIYHSDSGLINDAKPIIPGILRSENSVVFATPLTHFALTTSFAMLNQSRKEQLIRLLSEFDALPCYVPGDHELMIKTGITPHGRIVVLTNLSLDDVPQIELAGLKNAPSAVSYLGADGKWESVKWEYRNGLLSVSKDLRTLRPLILLIG